MRPITFKILLRTGADTGQALGSLFEIRGEAGEALAGAGFPWTFSSRVMGGTRRLELWSATPSPPEFHPLPEPPAETRSYRPVLGVDNDRLMLLDQGLAYNGAWEVPDSFAALATQGVRSISFAEGRHLDAGATICSLQRVQGKTLAFVNRGNGAGARVFLDGEKILETPIDLAAGIYFQGQIILSEAGTGRLHLHPWQGSGLAGGGRRIEFAGGGAYCFAPFNARLFFGDDRGKVWSLSNGDVHLELDRNIGEFYSVALWRDEIIFGYYPLPRLYAFNGSGWRTIGYMPPGELAVGASGVPIPYEAQALLIAAGRLWAGLYPFGEVAWSDVSDIEAWTRHRLFTHPPRHIEPYPYAFSTVDQHYGEESQTARLYRIGGSIGISNGDWAQRVQSLARCGQSVFAATGNMRGQCFDAKADPFLRSDSARDYGKIFEAQMPASCDGDPGWLADGMYHFELSIDPSNIRLSGPHLSLSVPANTEVFEAAQSGRLVWGDGIMGRSEAHIDVS